MTAEEYLNQVRFALRDLPWKMRRQLISELRDHLDELPDLRELGTPEQYAADLRAAAGLERCRGPIAFLRARRPRNLILTVVALTAIGLAIGAVAWIDSYQPITLGSGWLPPRHTADVPGGGSQWVVFHAGRPFEYGVSIQNTGRFTIRVLGVPYLFRHAQMFSARLMMSGPFEYKHGGLPLPSRRFHPFDLSPGQGRALYLEGVYHASSCGWGAGDSTGLFTFPVRFSFLWRTATAQIPLPEPLAIVVPKGGVGSCG